ncbi:uncharacterized acetyltransferase At3g50280 [Brassica napus]|nr:uncharacterized acetyltransferase At3g50280 [Brassica napus]
MADVVVLSKSIVRPDGSDSDRVKIHLTPWDLFFLRSDYPQRGLLFPKPDPETDIISQLKSSLSVALSIFYPFAGRLVKTENENDETASFLVDCDGSGVKFIHASAKTVSLSDVLEPVNGIVPEFLNRFFPANGVKSCEGVSESLIAFQVTELRDGVFIAFGYNHMVADGSSFWSFFNTWSEICSTGVDRDKKFPPLLLRGWFLDGIDHPIRIPISETVIPSPPVASSSSLLREKVFRFTRRNISELKSKANGEVSFDDRRISSLQAVSAHMWRSIIKNSDLNPEEVVYCKLLMDMRRRLNPPLDKECFGNVVGFATATTTAGEMVSNGLGWAALQINKTVGSQTDEGFRVFAGNWVKKPKIPNHVAVSSNSVIVASSPWFNVYGNDFGWGKPIAVRAGPGNTSDGKLIVYPGIEEGNIEIQTCLSSHVLEKLSADAEFLEHACVV